MSMIIILHKSNSSFDLVSDKKVTLSLIGVNWIEILRYCEILFSPLQTNIPQNHRSGHSDTSIL